MTTTVITPIDILRSGDLTWKDYIKSLSPEDLETQRLYDKARLKKWYQENKDKKLEYTKQWYQENKEKVAERCKKYQEDNKDKIAAKKKEWRERNRERYQTSHTCTVCGGSYTLKGKSEHEKTLKHQKALTQQGEQCAAQSS